MVARARQGELGAVFWATLLPSLAILTAGVIIGLPRLARWFFSGWGQDRSLRLLFVLVARFTTASLFDLIGIEAIVGALLAGLVLNRSIPNGGALMERIEFFGSALFIPLFLLATGMLIDPQVLFEPRTLLVGAAFTAMALVTKLLAAFGAGKLLGDSRPEIGTMFSLSAVQAAATLAAIVVPSETEAGEPDQVRNLNAEVTAVARSAGAEAGTVIRIDLTPAAGIAHTLLEQRATLLVMGWTGTTTTRGATFGVVIDAVLSRTALPTLLSDDGSERVRRILVMVDGSVTSRASVTSPQARWFPRGPRRAQGAR